MVYAFNWYNVGAVLPLIGGALDASTGELGIVLGAFLVGVGIFQVPAGLASIRWGSRRVSLWGVAVLGAAGLASAFAPSWPWLALARFLAGVGAAFFFSPALSLIASYFPAGRRGPIIGLYNGGFSLGGAVGIFGGAAVGLAFGWPWALASGGVALLAATFAAWLVLPRQAAEGAPGELGAVARRARGVFVSRSIWALSLGLTGFWAAIYIVAQYFVNFVHDVHPGWGIPVAAALVALVVVVSFPGGPVGGWAAERGWDRRGLLAGLGVIAGALVLAIPFTPLFALWPLAILLGFVDGAVFAVLYLIPSYLPEAAGEGLALGVAVINSIQVLLGGGLAIAFGYVAESAGYTTAWLIAGGLSLGLLPLLALVRPSRGTRPPERARAGPPPRAGSP